MAEKLKIGCFALLFMLLMILVLSYGIKLNAYEETTGSWTATEKRQVIWLLEKIERNTRHVLK